MSRVELPLQSRCWCNCLSSQKSGLAVRSLFPTAQAAVPVQGSTGWVRGDGSGEGSGSGPPKGHCCGCSSRLCSSGPTGTEKMVMFGAACFCPSQIIVPWETTCRTICNVICRLHHGHAGAPSDLTLHCAGCASNFCHECLDLTCI